MYKVLFAASEVYPLIKTGGLADVAGSLPPALQKAGANIRIILPAYADAMPKVQSIKPRNDLVTSFGKVTLWQGELPGSKVKVWLVDHPALFARKGNPYLGEDGNPWPDNAERFALFAEVIVAVATDRAKLRWAPDVVHCNDWQTGLVPALLSTVQPSPATVFTIHNLAYQGTFAYETFKKLGLPQDMWSADGLEYHNQMSFIKGGLWYADWITTVSPTYANEIQTPEFGYGLDGLLQYRNNRLTGVLNGVDLQEWNPQSDHFLIETYGVNDVSKKLVNKLALQKEFQLPEHKNVALIGMVGRLVEQKGIDLVLNALPQLVKLPIQLVLLGSGDPRYERELSDWAQRYPEKIGVIIGYDEALAHRIEGGADLFLMPSRFEPCGLNQMYSLRYGTLPIVRKVGGLADTVTDITADAIASGTATGVVFEEATAEALHEAVQRALGLFQNRAQWQQVQVNAMRQDNSWKNSAEKYLEIYAKIVQKPV